MKVLHVINTFSAGGAELHLLGLCHELKRRGTDVVVACLREQAEAPRPLRREFENEGIRVIPLMADNPYSIRGALGLGRLLREERPAVLHTHLPRADFAGALACLFSRSVVWLCSVHDIHSKTWRGRWTLPLFNLIWRQPDAVVAISHAVKEWLVNERGVPSERITVIHYGIAPEAFAHPELDLRRHWGLDGKLVIGSIGRLEPRKGHQFLIQAMPAVLEKAPNAQLLVAGADAFGYRRSLEEMIDRLRLNDYVKLVGFQHDIASFLGALDLFAFATRCEGFGQVVIEAMAAGKPVVASRIPPITEIVADAETGSLVEPENPTALARAISDLLEDPGRREQMGRTGRSRVEQQFNVALMAERTISLYDNLLLRRAERGSA